MPRTPYPDLWHRLMANIHEPEAEGACWYWARKLDREGYGQLNVYVPGLARPATLKAHIVGKLLLELGAWVSADDLYLAYQEHSASGLEFDHLCHCRGCLNPDHLELVTGRENSRRRRPRVSPRLQNLSSC